ncbi:MAG: GntR family transcriptional regulator [Oscillospiraceae bacterium]
MDTDRNTPKRKSSSMQVYEAIKEDILCRRLKSGEPLIEEELAEKYHVSRTPIREALRKLESDNFIVSYPYKRSVVCRFELKDIIEISNVRIILESACCHDIVAKGYVTESLVSQLEEYITGSYAAYNSGDYERPKVLGDSLHDKIIETAGNSRIEKIIQNMKEQLNTQYLVRNYEPIHSNERMLISIQEHASIVNAIKARNAVLAEEAMRVHLLNAQAIIIKAVGMDF